MGRGFTPKNLSKCVKFNVVINPWVAFHNPSQKTAWECVGLRARIQQSYTQKNVSKEKKGKWRDCEFISLGRVRINPMNKRHSSCPHLCSLGHWQENRALRNSKSITHKTQFPPLTGATAPCRAGFRGEQERRSLICILSSLQDPRPTSGAFPGEQQPRWFQRSVVQICPPGHFIIKGKK